MAKRPVNYSATLVKGAKPGSKGFRKNVSTEVAAGRPVKQAVAIAYSQSGEKRGKGARDMARMGRLRRN